MRRWLLPAVPGLLLLLLLALFSVPARVVPRLIDGEQLLLSGLSGSAVNGTAARALVQTPAGYFHLGALHWRLDLRSLLTLSPALFLESEWATQRGSLRLQRSDGQLRITELDAVLDAAIVQQALPVSVGGRLELLFDEILLEEEQLIAARGRLVWQDAAWRSMSGQRSLGTYLAKIDSPATGEVQAQVETLDGVVQVAGDARLLAQRFSTDLFISAAGSALDEELTRALSLVATPEENGYRLRLEGSLGAAQ